MSKIINIDKLKVESLKATGRTIYGQEEFSYIKFFSYDDNNAIKVRFYLLLKISDTEYDLFEDVTYSVADGKSFTDEKGFNVYKEDENGVVYQDIITEVTGEDDVVTSVTTSEPVKRDDDYTRNRLGFGQVIIPSIQLDIKNFIGIHNNSEGAIDLGE